MNMSSIHLEDLIVKFPQDCDTIQRVATFLSETSSEKVFTLQRLYDLALPSTTFVFAQLLSYLVEINVMKKIVRIESSNNRGGIKDFSSITEVPEEIYDWIQEKMIDVTSENIRILYRVANFNDWKFK